MNTKHETLILFNDKEIFNEEELDTLIKELFIKYKISKKINMPSYVVDLFKQQYDEFSQDKRKHFSQEITLNVGINIYQVKVFIKAEEQTAQEILNSLNEVYSLEREEYKLYLKDKSKFLQLDYAPLETTYAFLRTECHLSPEIFTNKLNGKTILNIIFNVKL